MVQSLSLCLFNNQKNFFRTVLVEEMGKKVKATRERSIIRAGKPVANLAIYPLNMKKWH